MARKKVNVANIGNLSNDNFYKVKKLCAKAEKLESIIEALQDYWNLYNDNYIFGSPESKNLLKPSQDVEAQIEAYEEEYMEIYHQIQKLLKK